MLNKTLLRNQMIDVLNKLPSAQKLKIENKLYEHLFTSSLWKNSNIIGTTWSYQFELDTKQILYKAWEEKKTICLPKSDMKQKMMEFYEIKQDSELTIGFKEIKEPDPLTSKKVNKNSLELIIVPGIVFDESGYRIGYGGGFYDRYLTTYGGTTVALASQIQVIPEIDAEVHDIPVQFIITEEGLRETKIK